MIRETIALINQRITEQILVDNVQTTDFAIPFYDQQEGMTTLKTENGLRLTLDSRYVWQSAHLTDGSRVKETITFGSFTDHSHEPRFILIGVSKSRNGLNVAMRAIDGVAYVVIDGYSDKTLEVLSRYWQVKAGPDKNYDPSLYAFAIQYHLTGVSDEDFAEMPTEADVAELPVEVPEPIQGPKGDTGPPGPANTSATGSGYVHTQATADSNWLITHNLGYNPAGILVYDSSGDQWIPAKVDYIDVNSLFLRFNQNSFGGKAYLS